LPLLNNGDIVSVKFITNMMNQYAINQVHMLCSGKINDGVTDTRAAIYWDLLIGPAYKDYLSAVASAYVGCKVQVVAPIPLPATYYNAEAGGGTVATNCLPTQVAMVVRLKTAVWGRRRQGRLFLPFWCEEHNDSFAQPSAGAKTLASALCSGFTNPHTVDDGFGNSIIMTPVIYSKVGLTTTPITSTIVDKQWGTHRSRSQMNRGDSNPLD